ncbi:LOW QUALITY PROTEIN: 40S ribosomal protein S2-like [Culex quinquefasciatus]|uniref:LOW QUALITY PROTEIN: 40S ribosomal protein S2-like n=1 Tax=Culex quinquefasciatus TaxID=7176 RepID=UPI0018E37A00|nr:LOW QUALITY PROTEIN: 40S ribosomal protein S2-like [Culex quinquefasciatus]
MFAILEKMFSILKQKVCKIANTMLAAHFFAKSAAANALRCQDQLFASSAKSKHTANQTCFYFISLSVAAGPPAAERCFAPETVPERTKGFGSRGGASESHGGRGRGRGRGKQNEWIPVPKLGRLVRDGKIRTLEEIYLYSLPILSRSLKDEVLKIMPVQKQTRAGQCTRFKAFVAIGDSNDHICLGVKCSKEVVTAIRGAIILAKLSVMPVHRGYWGNKIGKPHTVLFKVFGKYGSVLVRLNPVLSDTGIVPAPVPKKLLQMTGIEDCVGVTKPEIRVTSYTNLSGGSSAMLR